MVEKLQKEVYEEKSEKIRYRDELKDTIGERDELERYRAQWKLIENSFSRSKEVVGSFIRNFGTFSLSSAQYSSLLGLQFKESLTKWRDAPLQSIDEFEA